MFLRWIYDEALAQAAYVIGCQQTGEALVIDPARDIDRYYRVARENELRIVAVAETHIHADFVSGAREFAENPDVTVYLSALGGEDWSYRWPTPDTRVKYLTDDESFSVGKVEIRAVHTPGHTPEHLSYLIIDHGGGADEPLAIVTGDFLFVGDVGRPDLLESAAGVSGAMKASARTLHESIVTRLKPLSDFMQVLPGHGAGSACGKALGAIPSSTVGYERRFNTALRLAEKGVDPFMTEILAGQPEPPIYFKRMKYVNRDGIRVTGGVPPCPRLDAETFRRLASSDGARVVDTRPDRAAFEAGHAPGSLYAPLVGNSLVNSAGSFLSETDDLLLVLDDESALDEVTRQLYRIGLDRIGGWTTSAELATAGFATARSNVIEFAAFPPVPDGAAVLDVRTRSEFEEGHLPGAIHAPGSRLLERTGDLPPDRKYYAYCASGHRATIAASFLAGSGYDITVVNGDGTRYFGDEA